MYTHKHAHTHTLTSCSSSIFRVQCPECSSISFGVQCPESPGGGAEAVTIAKITIASAQPQLRCLRRRVPSKTRLTSTQPRWSRRRTMSTCLSSTTLPLDTGTLATAGGGAHSRANSVKTTASSTTDNNHGVARVCCGFFHHTALLD